MKKSKGPKVIVFYEIDKTGKARNVRVEEEVKNDVSGVWAKEAIRIISEMPTWTAGEQGGRPVNVQMSVPVRFDKYRYCQMYNLNQTF